MAGWMGGGVVRQDRGESRESGSTQYAGTPRNKDLIDQQKKNRTTGETRRRVHGNLKKADADAAEAERTKLEKQEAEKKLQDAIHGKVRRRKTQHRPSP